MTLPQNVEVNIKLVDILTSFKKGSVNHQVHHALEPLTMIGKSRHQAKREARGLKAKTPHEIAKLTGIHSVRTRREYQKSCVAFLKYCRDGKNFKDEKELKPERNALKITPAHVAKYVNELSTKVTKTTLMCACSALSKFASGLSKLDQYERNWDEPLKEAKKGIKPNKVEARAYLQPLELISQLRGAYKLMAELQLFNGLRIHEMAKLTAENLGDNYLHLINTKGGRYRATLPVPRETFEVIKSIIEDTGAFEPNTRWYQYELRKAAEATGQKPTGSHGLRHNYAQARMYSLTSDGATYEEARKIVAQELGHSRPSIVETYLKR